MANENVIYLDHAATTPLDDRVLKVMLPYFSSEYGNPSSVHRYGQKAEAAVENARETIAKVLNCFPEEIIFTSGGSESDNLALRGTMLAARNNVPIPAILTNRAEHPAVSKTAVQLEKELGSPVIWLGLSEEGQILPSSIEQIKSTIAVLASVMYANNEIGTINRVKELVKVAKNKGIAFHTDAVQAAGYLGMDVNELGVDLLSIGAHKFYGPKVVGVLFIRKGTRVAPLQIGGSHEFGMRAGTLNVPLIVGMAEALRLVQLEHKERIAHVTSLRDQIIGSVLEEIPNSRLTGHPVERLPNHASFAFEGVDGNLLLTLLDSAGFACSSGSACKTGDPEPSEVLTALGLPREWALGSLRVTLGKQNTPEQVVAFLKVLPGLVHKARALRQ